MVMQRIISTLGSSKGILAKNDTRDYGRKNNETGLTK